MGWADCGTDSTGRPIGYGVSAECDAEGCHEKIDRGLYYVCGDMHGSDEYSCERYFCENHKRHWAQSRHHTFPRTICEDCFNKLCNDLNWFYDEFDGVVIEK